MQAGHFGGVLRELRICQEQTQSGIDFWRAAALEWFYWPAEQCIF